MEELTMKTVTVRFEDAETIKDAVYGIPNDDVKCTLPGVIFCELIEDDAMWNVPAALLPVNIKYLLPCFNLISVIDGL
jgi:hypothetical protein